MTIKDKKSLRDPEQLHDLTLKLEHNPLRNDPEDLLYSLYCYTRGYKRFVKLIGEQVEPDLATVFQLDYVNRGSVELKNKTGYRPKMIEFVSNLLMKLLTEDTTDDNLEQKAMNVEQETAKFAQEHYPSANDEFSQDTDIHINRIDLAEVLKDMSDGAEHLQKNEYFEVKSDESAASSNVVRFRPSYRSHLSLSELKKAKRTPFNGEDKIIVHRPCNIGDGAWYVESVESKRKYYVRIADHDWLRDYQSGRMPVVRANDLLNVNLKCEIIETQTGTIRNANAIISKVRGREKGKHLSANQQASLF